MGISLWPPTGKWRAYFSETELTCIISECCRSRRSRGKNTCGLCQPMWGRRGGRRVGLPASSHSAVFFSTLFQSFITDHIFFYKEKLVWVEKNQKLSSLQFLEEWSSYYMGKRKMGKRWLCYKAFHLQHQTSLWSLIYLFILSRFSTTQ